MSSSSYYAPEAPRGGKTDAHHTPADEGTLPSNYAFKNATGAVEIDDMMYGTSVATSSASVRLGFIRKVYGILSFQLFITVFTCASFMYVPVLRSFIIAAGAVGQILLLVASLVTIFGLVMNKDSHPANMRWLIAFTLAESCTVGFLCALYQKNGLGGLVLEAFAITLAIFAGLTAYCFISKKDFSFMGGALFAGLMVLLGAMLVNGILGFTGHRSGAFSMVIACGGALLFSLYILYDTSLIMHNLQPDDYIMGAITLYLDIINLFLYILQILSSSQRD